MLVSYVPALPLGMEAKEECFEFRSYYRFEERALLRRLNRSARSGIRFLRVRRVSDSEASLNERIKGTIYSLDLKDLDVRAALEARKTSLGARPIDDIDFIQNELGRLIEGNPGFPIAFRVDRSEMRLYLELPALSRRGHRPPDVVSAVFGLENASVRLTRERLVFGQAGDQPSLLAAD
jgi:hypothetical protein